jgi:hypothetical protein
MDVITSLFYYLDENFFIDEDGFPIIYDLFKYVSPDELEIFRRNKETWYIPRGNLGLIELIYPDEEYERIREDFQIQDMEETL